MILMFFLIWWLDRIMVLGLCFLCIRFMVECMLVVMNCLIFMLWL